MSDSPAFDISGLLTSNNIDATPWIVRVGVEPEEPDSVVTVYDSGGLAPNPKWGFDEPSIQVRVRGPRMDYAAAYSKAMEVKNLLLGRDETILNGSAYTIWLMIGEINSLGVDDIKRPILTINFQLARRPATLGNRDAL